MSVGGSPRQRLGERHSDDETAAVQFHVVAFEGPDPYARAGGLASRVDGFSRALAALGFETHLWFVGDPDLPGHELRDGVRLHRWCQWLSRGHRGGVYDGEEGKWRDISRSLAPYLLEQVMLPALEGGRHAVVLAEEWHTAEALLDIDRRLRDVSLRERASLLWNANNVFGFDRIAWEQLRAAVVITTVSRNMRYRMEAYGVHPLVIANGLPPEAFQTPARAAVAELRARLRGRTPLVKVARWDPEKNWAGAVRGVVELKRQGLRPLLVARGGAETHEAEVRELARSGGLRWADRSTEERGSRGVGSVLDGLEDVDLVCLRFPLDGEASRLLFRAADAVLADSRFEPFGLVGLETMAVAGVACVGVTGEDYATPGRNALVLQTEDPRELAGVLRRLRQHPEEERRLRRTARMSAHQYAWSEIATRLLLPRLELLRAPVSVPPLSADLALATGAPLRATASAEGTGRPAAAPASDVDARPDRLPPHRYATPAK